MMCGLFANSTVAHFQRLGPQYNSKLGPYDLMPGPLQ
jgi:hypothetical protein